MASVVFTDADLKVFLTASVEARAQRRHKQLMDKGMHASVTALSQEIAERDARDSQRAVAPMSQSEDSLLLDTTEIGPQEACDRVLGWYRQRAGR
jgi:cytidylate kinase